MDPYGFSPGRTPRDQRARNLFARRANHARRAEIGDDSAGLRQPTPHIRHGYSSP